MIASLRGKVIYMGVNRVIVEAQGVGYDVAVSLSTRDALPENEDAFLHIHTAMRDNALELYGFTTLEEKRLFEMLITVAGVGPRTSLQVLSGISPQGFCQAVIEGDSKQLVCIPGIGKKSAERIILELKEKIKKMPALGTSRTDTKAASTLGEDLVSSLINLGYTPRAAETTAKNVLKDRGPNLTLSEAVRAALKEASK